MSYVWLVQCLEQPVLYKLLINLPIWAITLYKEKQLRKSLSSDWPIISKPLVYQVVSESIVDHMVICEWVIVF